MLNNPRKRSLAVSATLRASTALSLVLAASLASPAHADSCTVDNNIDGRIYIQICKGEDGVRGADGGKEQDGQPGTDGGAVGGGGLAFDADFPGVAGKPTILFSGQGGRGGDGGSGGQIGDRTFTNGGDAGSGGNGWDLGFTLGSGRVDDGGNATTPLTLLSKGGNGGKGGAGGEYGAGGAGGAAGSGGALTFVEGSNAAIVSSGAGIAAVSVISQGGVGGDAQGASTSVNKAFGKPGGVGGNAGAISVTISGAVRSGGAGVTALSLGGKGGGGGQASTTGLLGAQGGDGGQGGGSADVTLTLAGGSVVAAGAVDPATGPTQPAQGGIVTFSAPVAAGLQARTEGGDGGVAGNAEGNFAKGTGGSGGSVNAGSAATVDNQGGTITTTGYASVGILGQSIGAGGGNGGYGGGVFVANGGNGSLGGNAGVVTLTGRQGTVSTAGDGSAALVGQSIGGGGGYGGDARVEGVVIGVAVGGDSANGGNGGAVTITNGVLDAKGAASEGQILVTRGYKSPGFIGQSIGGGGGVAGDANALVPGGVLSVAIGGNAGTGGNASPVSINNGGIVQTAGPNSSGIDAQSVGGGGGSGGAANSFAIGSTLTVAAAVGGNGGAGGDAKQVTIQNNGQVVTNGSDSYGIVGQSIGGGGGHGGTALARTIQVFNDPEIPSVDLKVSLGGAGNTGGVGGLVVVTNDGAVLTTGTTADGIIAQSIGGGGGDGGDSNALDQSFRSSSINITTSIGGQGGSGGVGGNVFVVNSNLIATLGDAATAVFAHSVGGGGGIGGYGQADTGSFTENDLSLQSTIAVGGKGGSGGNGGTTIITNSNGGILTRGNKARAVFAQSIGGGGGVGGGAVAKGGGGAVNLNVAVGGGGGAGGDGSEVQVANSAALLTLGGDAAAIVAQSIGGGGGSGGTAAVGDGSEPQVTIAEFIAKGLGIGADVVDKGDGAYELKENTGDAWNSLGRLKNIATAYNADNPIKSDDGKENKGGGITVNVGGGVAGNGGSAGNGGTVMVTNTGTIETTGPASEGMFAQSVGGGGGEGGASISGNGAADISAVFAVGGRGGSGGNGNTMTMTNKGSLTTTGDLSFGIFGQSIGGGGGKGGISGGEPSAFSVASVSIGGGGGSNGQGGQLTITNSGALTTGGRDAIGIVAQSIGGGGGLASLMTVGDANSGGDATSHTGFIPRTTLVPIIIGGAGGASGNGNHVTVKLIGGAVTTSGIDAYGVLAQSIGGGGGLVAGSPGSTSVGNADSAFGSGRLTGNGGNADVALTNGATIRTSGAGAVGILVQSLGGGGGLVGGMSQVDLGKPVQVTGTALHSGSGNDITVLVDASSSVLTTGERAHGLVAQSAGGGAGLYGRADSSGFTIAGLNPIFCGGNQQLPCTGNVAVNLDGSIHTTGAGAYGIYAQSRGNGGLAPNRGAATVGVQIAIGNNGTVSSDRAAAIYIDSPAGNNRIDNKGMIFGGTSGVAIDGTGSADIFNSGVISGDIVTSAAAGGYNINNYAAGRIITGKNIQLQSALLNQGELWVGTSATNGTIIRGDLNSTGTIITGIDFATGKVDDLIVEGNAAISGAIYVNPMNLQAGAVQLLFATKSLTVGTLTVSNFKSNADGTLTPVAPYLYQYGFTSGPRSLFITAAADFTPSQVTLNANQLQLAENLQRLFDNNTDGVRPLLGNLLQRVAGEGDYRATLDNLGADTLGSLAVVIPEADRTFTGEMMSCPALADQDAAFAETNCAWSRAGGMSIDRDGTPDAIGYRTRMTNLQIGGQRHVSADWLLGGSIAYENSRTRADGSMARIRGKSVVAGVFAKRQAGPLSISGAITGGVGWYDTQRNINIGGLQSISSASPDLYRIGAHGRVAYQTIGGSWYLRTLVDLDATYAHVDAFLERGSLFALAISNRGEMTVSETPMLEIGARARTGGDTFVHPYLRGGATFRQGQNWHLDARFASAEDLDLSFRSTTVMPRVTGTVGAGLDVMVGQKLQLKLQYDADLSRNYSSRRVTVRFAYLF